ncbi:esterase-like protein [Colletotrichum musicola]|uniref:Esterase-like protein n=1 Tax=Colletotrichum musicola TaxID=2175873 RepID=A0A8H6NIN0_9PEZI|nr:esterase-like protein [Colletotrichum musicola]
MKRFAALNSRRVAGRWTPETFAETSKLAETYNRGLGADGDGNPLTINWQDKTVSTAIGDLPISPVMDPNFAEAKGRHRQPKTKMQTGGGLKERLRKKLRNNPYAHALASPIRADCITKTNLPSFFHQKFKGVINPSTGDLWAVPEDITTPETVENHRQEEEAQEQDQDQDATENNSASEQGPWTTRPAAPEPPSSMGAPTTYVLARNRLLKNMGRKPGAGPHAGQSGIIFARRERLPKALKGRTVWRHDMHDFVLENMRRQVVKTFLYYLRLHEQDGRDYIRPCSSWEVVKDVKHRGCLLWLPPDGHGKEDGLVVSPFSTYDVPGANWEKRLPVHDLERLLGPEHLATLRKHPLFRDHTLLVLGKHRSVPLQLYLWKLQGYLLEYPHDEMYENFLADVEGERQKWKRQRIMKEKNGIPGQT